MPCSWTTAGRWTWIPACGSGGAAHRDAVLRAAPATWNGPILGFRALEGDTVIAGRTDYFTMLATSDALRAERERLGESGPLRTAARRAGGRRSAAQRRRTGLGRGAVDPARAHPRRPRRGSCSAAGRATWRSRRASWGRSTAARSRARAPGPCAENLARELAEEAPGVVALSGRDAGALAAGARLQGLTMNMLRLSPTISVEIRIDLPRPPDRADLLSRGGVQRGDPGGGHPGGPGGCLGRSPPPRAAGRRRAGALGAPLLLVDVPADVAAHGVHRVAGGLPLVVGARRAEGRLVDVGLGLRPTSRAAAAWRSRAGSSISGQTITRCAAVRNCATKVHPSAGHGQASVRTQYQPL